MSFTAKNNMSALDFSIPYNNDPETLTEIFKWKECNGNRIKEIYLSGPQQYAGSGRISKAQSFDEFAETVKRIHQEKIRVNLLLNSVCEGAGWYSKGVLNSTLEYLQRVFEDLDRYGEITDFFKLVGRTSSMRMILRSLEAYMHQSWNGDLLELMAGNFYSYGMSSLIHIDNNSLDDVGFFEKVTSCDRECIDCDFCEQLSSKLIKRGVMTPEKAGDIGLQ